MGSGTTPVNAETGATTATKNEKACTGTTPVDAETGTTGAKEKLRPNWTKCLEEVNSILNRQCGWAKNDVSAYVTGFGIDFDPIMPESRDSIRRCTTIQERMDVVAASITRFRAVVESMYDFCLRPIYKMNLDEEYKQ